MLPSVTRRFALIATFLVLCVCPAASDDVATAQSIIRSQAEAFARDDATAAYAYASPEIHQQFPEAAIFLRMVQTNYAAVYRHRSFEFGEARTLDGKVAQQVRIVDSEGVPWDALYTLEQQTDGSLKIVGCTLIKAGEAV